MFVSCVFLNRGKVYVCFMCVFFESGLEFLYRMGGLELPTNVF